MYSLTSSVQVIACCLFSTKPLLEPMMNDYQQNPYKQTSLKSESKYHNFHSTKCIWRYFVILSRSHDHLPLTYPPYISHCNYSGHSVHSRTSFSLRQRHSCISQPCLVTFLTARDKHKTCYTSYHVKKSTHLTTKGHFSGSYTGIIILVPYHFNQATVTNLKIGCQIASRCNCWYPLLIWMTVTWV